MIASADFYEMRRLIPPTRSLHFKASFICHGGESTNGQFLVGVIGPNHLVRGGMKQIWHGSHGEGYGWVRACRRVRHPKCDKTENFTSDVYKDGQVATVEIDKNRKLMIMYKKGTFDEEPVKCGEFPIKRDIPDELYLSVSVFRRLEFEFVEYFDFMKQVDVDEEERCKYVVERIDEYSMDKVGLIHLKLKDFEVSDIPVVFLQS